MKLINNTPKIILVKVLLLFFAGASMEFMLEQSNQSTIVGSWISEKDPKSKLIFYADGKCEEYYNSFLQEKYFYTLENKSPQCSQEVFIDNSTNYLSLTNIKDSSDKYCDEVNGLTTEILSLRYLESGGILISKKIQ